MTFKQTKHIGSCLSCKFAYLMRSNDYNPVVCKCDKTQSRHVAVTIHECRFYEKVHSSTKPIINKIIFL